MIPVERQRVPGCSRVFTGVDTEQDKSIVLFEFVHVKDTLTALMRNNYF